MLPVKSKTYDQRPLWKQERHIPHTLHKMLSRPGSMPPQLPKFFIAKYSAPGDLILDPFCGKGTGLLEASLLGRRTLGFDVALDAVIAANAKVDPPSLDEVSEFLDSVEPKRYKRKEIPWQVRVFFSPKTLSQLLEIRDSLLAELSEGTKCRRRIANFLLGTLLGILHGHSKLSLSLPCSHSFGMAPRYVRNYTRRLGLRRPSRNVKECLLRRSEQLLCDDPPPVRGRVLLFGAEKYPCLGAEMLTNSVDLIVTSPPYLNVQTYPKDSWLRLWLLGFDYKKIKPRFIETGSPKLYLERMAPCLREMLRALKPRRYAVIVAGDAPIATDGERRFFKCAEELGALATGLVSDGFTFKVDESIVDDIPAHARYYAAVHKDGNKGRHDAGRKGVRLERIIVLKKVEATSVRFDPPSAPTKTRRMLQPEVVLSKRLQKLERLFMKWDDGYPY